MTLELTTGADIRAERQRIGISQKYLAKNAPIKLALLSAIESGDLLLHPTEAARLRKALKRIEREKRQAEKRARVR